MKINNLMQKTVNFIENSPKIHKILLKIDKNPSLFNATYTAILATTLKPVSILALSINTKEGKEDGKYASAKSISTGIIDFLISLVIFIPVNKRLDKISNKLFSIEKSIYFKNTKLCDNYKSVMNRVFKIAILPVFAYCKFGVLEPFEKLMFGKRNENSNK